MLNNDQALNRAFILGITALAGAIDEGRPVSYVRFQWGMLIRSTHVMF